MKAASIFTLIFVTFAFGACQKENTSTLEGDKALLSGKTICTNSTRRVQTPYNQSNFMIQNVDWNQSQVEFESHVFHFQTGGTLVDIDGIQYYSIVDSYGKLIAFQNAEEIIPAGLRMKANRSFDIYFLEGDFPTTVIQFGNETF
ncbi:MAG: hypothetical protein ACO3GK_03000 [Bacteroidia bacterium]